jgi:hypothetical protein
MTRWLVQITGERVDLLEFQRVFPAGEAHIIEEDGQFFLTGSSFDRVADAAVAQSCAAEIIDDMFPVVSVAWRIARKPDVGNVIYEDEQGNRHPTMLVPLAGLRMHAMSAGEVPIDGPQLLTKLRSSPRLRAAGKSWSAPHRSWSHLFNIYWELRKYLGKNPDAAGICRSDDADTVHAIGAVSRRGRRECASRGGTHSSAS